MIEKINPGHPDKLAARSPDAEIEIDELGPVIGAHTGPGLLALIYWGSIR